MQRLRFFMEMHPGRVLRLPTAWTAGANTQGSEAQFPLFNAVFDAAQIGQWVGGADPMHEAIRGYCCFMNKIGCVLGRAAVGVRSGELASIPPKLSLLSQAV
jgi:hypothetical protein